MQICLRFSRTGFLGNGEPRRYLDLKRLNDGLRERGRDALISYLCRMNRVALPWMRSPTYATAPGDLSDLLLLDVETGICEKTSRIEEAISAVQAFIRRSRLGLEPDWKVTSEFARLWDSRFETYHTWERCKRRELYRENWIEWAELDRARRIEAFRFLESQLRSSTLALAAPGGLDWWADDERSLEHAPKLLQRRVPSELQPLLRPPSSIDHPRRTRHAGQPRVQCAGDVAGCSPTAKPLQLRLVDDQLSSSANPNTPPSIPAAASTPTAADYQANCSEPGALCGHWRNPTADSAVLDGISDEAGHAFPAHRSG